MIGIGTIVNTGAVIGGGLLGIFMQRGINESMKNTLMKALGLSSFFIGVSGALTGLLTINDGKIQTSGTFLMILSMVIGTIIGELLHIEEHLDHMGERLKKLLKAEGNNRFVEGFVTNSLVICIGAMAVVGSLQDGLIGDPSMLYAKSILDGIISIIFASTMGIGVVFSAIPLVLYQGSITLFSGIIAPFLSDALIANISYIGSVLITGVGINLIFGNKIKVGNMLPALLVPIIYAFLVSYGLF